MNFTVVRIVCKSSLCTHFGGIRTDRWTSDLYNDTCTPLPGKSCASQIGWCESLNAPMLLLKWPSIPHITAALALSYNFPHDFAGKGELSVLGGVLPKWSVSELRTTLSSLHLVVSWPVVTRMRGSTQYAGLEANGKVKGIGEISNPYPSPNLGPIWMPLQIYHYVCPGNWCAKFD